MKKLALVLIALAAGCTEKVHVNIACDPKNTPTGPTAECIVHQDKGKAEVEVCWDFSVDCPGGVVVKAERQCTKVKDGGKATVTITKDKLANIDACAAAGPGTRQAKIANMTINGKAGTPD